MCISCLCWFLSGLLAQSVEMVGNDGFKFLPLGSVCKCNFYDELERSRINAI